jgi:hypothetical protein
METATSATSSAPAPRLERRCKGTILALQKIEGSSPFIRSSEPAGNGGMPRACEGQCQGLPLCDGH